MRLPKTSTAAWCATATATLLAAHTARGADHVDAPGVRADGQTDINDLFAFRSPANPDNSVLILTVNPFAGVEGPFGNVSPTDFATDVNYDIVVDNDGDAVGDVTFRTTFSGGGDAQSFSTVRTAGGTSTAVAAGGVGGVVAASGGGSASAGLFDDPFFFDFAGFNDGFNFTGTDAFAGSNVSAIVLEVPSADLGPGPVGLYAETLGPDGRVDRVGRPAINTALIPDGSKDVFNQGDPADDLATFGPAVNATITALSDTENADALTPVLLPDLLTFDPSSGDGFLNGRQLTDDVIDAALNLVSAGAVTGDGVDGNDVPFRGVFPFLAAAQNVGDGDGGDPNVIPTPGAAAAGLVLLGLAGVRRRR